MNAFARIATEYETVSIRDGSYTMTPDDFSEIHCTRTDALSGRTWAYGRNLSGVLVSAPLGVPLCSGCDLPITDGICPDCCVVFVGEVA
jgi:hypothetical protein